MSAVAPRPSSDAVAYEEAKRLARSPDADDRRLLAEARVINPELLYYLAGDPLPGVRRAIAANPATPRQADLVLAKDDDQTVRECLAAKIARVLPHLSRDEHDSIYRLTVQVLETLARDQATHVRRILSEALKDVTQAPPEIIVALARDAELAVAVPVLEFSPLLTEEDLLEIIAMSPAAGKLCAISRRKGLQASVADAVVETGDPEAVASLLGNASAQIREETLNRIIDQASGQERWHAPLVHRPLLPKGAVKRIASFVAGALLRTLSGRSDLDPETMRAVAAEVDRRLAAQTAADEAQPTAKPGADAAEKPDVSPRDQARQRASAMQQEGKLDEDAVLQAVNSGDRMLAIAALSVRSGIAERLVEHLFSLRSAKGVLALVWKCGFTMRLASQVQTRLAGIPPQSALRARGGVAFPLTEADMEWQIDFIRGLGKE